MGWKEVEFTGSDSAERVRRLQALCASDTCDGILIIGGVDSFHSQVSQAVLKYLLIGSAGQELLGEQVISQEHDRLEDVVLMLTRQRVSIFYSSESDAAVQILPMISQWRHVTEYVVHDGMDPDEQEARKIQAFRRMVRGVKRIGIPYGTDACGADLQDAMVPEKWPLVQSYGLEDGAHGKGFFTMNHAVVNVSRVLREEMAKLDDFGAKRIVQEVEPLLTHHYNQFLLKLDHAESPAVRAAKSESDMGEDLLSLYDFGTTQHDARGLQIAAHRGSRVLFGKRSSVVATKASSSAFLHNSGGVPGHAATHMRVQTEDPFTGVRFTRSYFHATGKVAHRVVDEDALVHPQAESAEKLAHDKADDASVDTTLLVELYVLLLRGFRAAVQALALKEGGQSDLAKLCASAKAEAIGVMTEFSRAHSRVLQQYALPATFLADNVLLDVECIDACGRDTAFPAPKWNLLYVSMEIKHVPSQLAVTESLGSVAVGDTILFKTEQQQKQPGTLPFLNVTSSFPYFRSWVQHGREAESAKALLAVLQSGFMLQSPALQLGYPLTPLDAALDEGGASSDPSNPANSIAPAAAPSAMSSIGLARAMLLLECEELPLLHGSMQLFSGGFCFKTPQLNPLVVSFARDVACFRILSTPFEELVLLQLEFKAGDGASTAIARVLPFATTSRCVAFPLLAGTRFQEEIVRALATWKTTAEQLELPFFRPHDLTAYEGATPRDGLSAAADVAPVMAKTCEALVRKQPQHTATLVDQLFPRWFIPRDANPTTTLPKPRADRSKIVVPITITLGLPGSDARAIAKTICGISSAANDWVQIDIDARDAASPELKDASLQYDHFVFTQVQTRVGAALQRIVNGTSALPPRIMLSVVGYVDPIAVAAAIKTASWAPQTKLAAVIACVSALNAYLPDVHGAQSPFPKLFDQLTAGFATHVVLTQSSDVAATQLGRLRYHIDHVNPFADIQVLSSDVFEGSITSLLSIDRFESAYYAKYRDALFPAWDRAGKWELHVAELDAALTPQAVRFEIAPGIEKTRFLQSVGKTLTPYAAMTKSMDKIHPFDQQMMARSSGKGIRLAQSLAVDKVLQPTTPSPSLSQSLLHDEESKKSEYGDCWNVEATVTFAGDATGTVYHYVSTGSYARLNVVATTAQESGALEIKVTGRDLNPAKLSELILGCYVKMDGAVQPMRNKIALTLQEKREIQKHHMTDPLPEGFYYDGISYVDQFGGRHEFHPNMSEFIDEHVRAANERAAQNNAKVEENRKSQQAYVKQIC